MKLVITLLSVVSVLKAICLEKKHFNVEVPRYCEKAASSGI